MSGKYIMSVNLQVVNHLGINLYSNTPVVISEAVANAWDADATGVEINIDADTITIKDNGTGMDCQDINRKYLNVGYQKRTTEVETPTFHRPVMGRKGIGKLSLFSIANVITVCSNKNGEKNALVISTKDLIDAIDDDKPYYPQELPQNQVDFNTSGTRIILSDLKKRRTAALSHYLKQRLARRFCIIGANFNFIVSVNGEEIKPSDRNLLPKAQCIWIYPPIKDDHPSDEYVTDLLSQCNANILKLRQNRASELSLSSGKVCISGWLATAPEPSALQDSDNINKIVIMVRGKMAKEDVLPEIKATALYTKYLFGEIHADFLDLNDEPDISTSSRQDFFEDDERYSALIEFIKSELSYIRTQWEEFRSNKGIEEACKFEVVSGWYSELKGDEKRAAQKLFGKINQLTVEPAEKLTLFQHGILAFESCKLKNELGMLETVSADNLDTFLAVAGRLDDIEATMYYQIVSERLAVIKKMQEVVSDGSLEKVVQAHLGKNLWLLDPSWDRSTELPTIEQAFRTQFDIVDKQLTPEELDARLDIRYKKTSGKHIIIELKKGDRTVKLDELYGQITKYSEAMEKVIAEHTFKEPYEIIILLGRKAGGNQTSDGAIQRFEESLNPYHTRILYYNGLLANAEFMYRDYLEKNQKSAALNNMIQQITVEQ